jgi:hypothetical protein
MKIRKTRRCPLLFWAWLLRSFPPRPADVNITHDLAAVEVMHHGKKVSIERVQDTDNMLDPDFR